MKKLLLLLSFVLFSFNANSEIINLKLLCKVEFSSYKNQQLYAKQDNFETVIEIKNNKFQDGKTLFNLNVSENYISTQIIGDNKQVLYMFTLNRYTGEFKKFMSTRFTFTEFTIFLDGKCEKVKSKKF